MSSDSSRLFTGGRGFGSDEFSTLFASSKTRTHTSGAVAASLPGRSFVKISNAWIRMTEHLPAPPVAQEVELTDFAFMPLEVLRLRRSKAWLICKRRPELAFYMVNLWTAAWHERPAGSLEDDDDVLADLSMCPPKDWLKMREDVLRGWIRCSDGRLYHPVVIEKVRDAWRSKMQHNYDRECGRLRKAAERAGNKKTFLPPTFEEWDKGRASSGNDWMSAGRPDLSNGRPPDKQTTSHECPPENALKGEVRDRDRDSKGYTSGQNASTGRPPDISPPDTDHRSQFELVKGAYPNFSGRQDWITAEHHCVRLVEEGLPWIAILEAVGRYAVYVAAGGVSGPQYVMTPAKFFSATDKPWQQPWTPPPTKGQLAQDANIEAARNWLAQSEGK